LYLSALSRSIAENFKMSERQIAGLRPEAETASRLGVGIVCLRKWRRKQYGPTPTKVGRFYYYSDAAIAEFLASCVQPLSQPRRGRAA
jgi:hypothetical protein